MQACRGWSKSLYDGLFVLVRISHNDLVLVESRVAVVGYCCFQPRAIPLSQPVYMCSFYEYRCFVWSQVLLLRPGIGSCGAEDLVVGDTVMSPFTLAD